LEPELTGGAEHSSQNFGRAVGTPLPAPLVAGETNLQDFSYLPVDVVRLRDSGFAADTSGDEFRAGFLLRCAAWHQLPAASLPDNDAVLSSLAGYGRVVREWALVREGALRDWVKCSDGRLYHPVDSEKANYAWGEKLSFRWKRDCDRVRKENAIRKEKGLAPLEMPAKPQVIGSPQRSRSDIPKETTAFPSEISATAEAFPSEGRDIPSETRHQADHIPPEIHRNSPLKGKGKGKGEQIDSSSSSVLRPRVRDDDDFAIRIEKVAGAKAPLRRTGISALTKLLDKGVDLELDILPELEVIFSKLRKPLGSWNLGWVIAQILWRSQLRRNPRLRADGTPVDNPAEERVFVEADSLDWPRVNTRFMKIHRRAAPVLSEQGSDRQGWYFPKSWLDPDDGEIAPREAAE
jgi:hypothetical protein